MFIFSTLTADDCTLPDSPPVSFTNKTDRHDIAEILLKVAFNTIKQTKQTINPSRISSPSIVVNQKYKLYHIMLYTLP
jgi:hypothetical protein